ncbi:MAG: DNA-binding transcriptional MerR regulator [Verrucomicrobiales bacterium]|jgi:DNA-binding transcriptional MerR regulator
MSAPVTDEQFQINTVARLSGVSQHTIRAWEKRYRVVTPERTDTQRRIYSREDVHRLTLLKSLVDNGHTIGSLAAFDTGKLEALLQEDRSAAPAASSCRVVVVGDSLVRLFQNELAQLSTLELAGAFSESEAAQAGDLGAPPDLLVIETPTLFDETVSEVKQLREFLKARRALIVYRFAPNEIVRVAGNEAGLTMIRGPVNGREIELACLAGMQLAEREASPSQAPTPAGEIPPRRFTNAQLAELTKISAKVQCECPQHLANLIFSLTAFETYSSECENRNKQDAELHAYLHQATATSRATIEEALTRVLEAEGIEIN